MVIDTKNFRLEECIDLHTYNFHEQDWYRIIDGKKFYFRLNSLSTRIVIYPFGKVYEHICLGKTKMNGRFLS
jgi:hypothetical protein